MSTITAATNRCTCVVILLVGVIATTLALGYPSVEQNPNYREFGERRSIGRRHAPHSTNPPSALSTSTSTSDVVVGKFKAPAPDRIQKSRLRSDQTGGAQVLGASMMVTDSEGANEPKIVHGIGGRSEWGASTKRDGRSERVVSAKMQVSDEGLNYPPSKLSADIYGNVAEIITAPPSAVDPDFLVSYPANEQQNMKQLLQKEHLTNKKKQKLHKRERKFY